jgi:hypothetical protein
VFNQRDHAARRAADILWADDDSVTQGRDALDTKAVELQAKMELYTVLTDLPE